MWARYWAPIMLTSALIYAYSNGLGLPFQQMFILIPPKPMVIHPLFVKNYSKNPESPLSALLSHFPLHILRMSDMLWRLPQHMSLVKDHDGWLGWHM